MKLRIALLLAVAYVFLSACQTGSKQETEITVERDPVAEVWRCSDELDRIGLLAGQVEDKVLFRLSISPKVLLTIDEYDNQGFVREFSLFAQGSRHRYRLKPAEPGSAIMLERRFKVTVPGDKPQMLELGIKEKVAEKSKATGPVQLRFTRLSKAPKLAVHASHAIDSQHQGHLLDAQLETAQTVFDAAQKHIARGDGELEAELKGVSEEERIATTIRHYSASLDLAEDLATTAGQVCTLMSQEAPPVVRIQAMVRAQRVRLQRFARDKKNNLADYKYNGPSYSASSGFQCLVGIDNSFVEPLALTGGAEVQRVEHGKNSVYVGIHSYEEETGLVRSLLIISGTRGWIGELPASPSDISNDKIDGGNLMRRMVKFRLGGRVVFAELAELVDPSGRKVKRAPVEKQAEGEGEGEGEELYLPTTMISEVPRGERSAHKFTELTLRPIEDEKVVEKILQTAVQRHVGLALELVEQMSPDDPAKSPVELVLWRTESTLRDICPRLLGGETEQAWHRVIELMTSRLERF